MVREEPQGTEYRDIKETPLRLAAALEVNRGGAFVGAEACSTQSGRVWYWYCLEHQKCSDRQFATEELATEAAVVHDTTLHAGRRR